MIRFPRPAANVHITGSPSPTFPSPWRCSVSLSQQGFITALSFEGARQGETMSSNSFLHTKMPFAAVACRCDDVADDHFGTCHRPGKNLVLNSVAPDNETSMYYRVLSLDLVQQTKYRLCQTMPQGRWTAHKWAKHSATWAITFLLLSDLFLD